MKVNDYVMGKDRSYRRSVYKVTRFIDEESFELEFICLDGRLGQGEKCERIIEEFTVADLDVVHKELGKALGYFLIGFVIQLVDV